MLTSAAGTPTEVNRRHAGQRSSGFTLLEVLVVIVIIGIILSMAVISVHVLGGDHEMDQEAARLQALLVQSREDAMMVGADVGLRLEERGYGWLRYDSRKELWQPVDDDPVLRARELPAGLALQLRVDGRDVPFKRPESTDLLKEAAPVIEPQILVQASGDLVPFDVILRRDGTTEERRVAGTAEGKIEVHDDARERQQ